MMEGTYYKEWSAVLDREMEFKVYGHGGVPVLALPARGGRFYDWENNGMPDAAARLLHEGKIQLFCADSIDGESLLAGNESPRRRAEMQEKYFVYLTSELAARIAELNAPESKEKPLIWCVGVDTGAYQAVQCRLRRPRTFAGAMGLSGLYDMGRFLGSVEDDLVLRSSPLAALHKNGICDRNVLSRAEENSLLLCVGQGGYEGDALADFAGPLGHPSEFVKMPVEELRKRRYLFVAGGVGTAPVYPQVKWLRKHGVKADVIIGAKTRDMLIYTDAMRAVAENLHIATDDGSEGFKGLVTQVVEELVEKQGRHYDECVAIGPMVMMKFVALTTKKYGLKTTVSLNALMVDGTGMCGACRVTVGGRTRFTCVEGPEFDGHEGDFDEAMRRQGMYRTQEQRAAAIEAERAAGHQCKIGLDK